MGTINKELQNNFDSENHVLFKISKPTSKSTKFNQIFSKDEAKNTLMDNQRKLNLSQNEHCVLNYLIKISQRQDWIIKNPIVEINAPLAADSIGLEIPSLLSSLYVLERKGLIVKKNKHKHILSLFPLIGLLLPFCTFDLAECYS